MAVLKEDQKMFIIQRAACFATIDEIKKEFKEAYKLELTSQQIDMYNPTKVAGGKLSKKWVDAFNNARERFLEQVSNIPIANKAYRMQKLNSIFDKAEKMKNFPLAKDTLEQAAKEMGEAYTNTRNLNHESPKGTMTPKSFSKEEYQAAEQGLSKELDDLD